MVLPLQVFHVNILCHLVVCVSALFLFSVNLPVEFESQLWPSAIFDKLVSEQSSKLQTNEESGRVIRWHVQAHPLQLRSVEV